MTSDFAACPACKASPISGRYCRECGAELQPSSHQAEHHPARPTAPTGPPQQASIHQQPVPADAPPLIGQAHYAPAGQTNGWAPQPSVPPPALLPSSTPASYWIPKPAQGSAPGRHSTALAAGATIAIVLVLLAIAATVILLVASGGSNHTGILTQSTTTGSKSEQAASP